VKEISVEITQIHESHAPPELNVVMLACELHDGACQQFVGAAAAFETYRHLLPDDAAGAWKEYELGMSRLRRGIGELRALLSGLRPMYLEGRGLDAALADLVRECEEKPWGFPSSWAVINYGVPHYSGGAFQHLPSWQKQDRSRRLDSRTACGPHRHRGLGRRI
jgi:hypothetical protein